MACIAINLEKVWESVKRAARRAGGGDSEVSLVAVTKQVQLESVLEAINCGIKEIGENRIQEAEGKLDLLPPGVKKHLVGNLQTNKVNKAIQMFDLIQSVDGYKLAAAIDRRAADRIRPVLVEVNTSKEKSKSGILPEQTVDFLKSLQQLDRIKIEGLMTIGPFTQDPEAIRNSFRTLRKLFEQAGQLNLANCKMEHLSMGMSADYEIAIEEGSNMVRIGSAIFGSRN
jgi:pyridoxal phosphate enzyme (YggS family)